MSAEHARWWATGAVPPALEAAFDAAGWARSRSGSPVIVRPCDDWQAGLDALRDQGERERGRTVLIGEDPPQDIGPRLRAAGGLAWMAPPWPAWMFPLLAATRERSRNERPLHRIHELATVEQLAGTTREEVLTSLAACARDVLRAHVEVWLRRDGKAPFELATATREPARAPPGLTAAALRYRDLVVVPSVAHARVCAMPDPPAASALAVPILAADDDDEPGAVMVLVWDAPGFLPTVGEYRILEILGMIGRVALRRLNERDRILRRHMEQTRALTTLLLRTTDQRETSPTADDLVEHVLATHGSQPGMQAIWARVSADTRRRRRWHGWPTPSLAPPPEATLEWALPGEPRQDEHGSWWVHTAVGGDTQLGSLAASFSSRAAAAQGDRMLVDLAAPLAYGARMLRRAADNDVLDVMSNEQTAGVEPRDAMRAMLERIRDRMSADGARVHVLSRAPTGPELSVQESTDGQPPVPEARLDVARVGGHRNATTGEGTTTHLLVGIGPAPYVIGVLEVWRRDPTPFDDALDVEALRRFGPHVAAASRRLQAADLMRARLQAMATLLDDLIPSCSVHAAATHVVERIGRLAGAAGAVLVRRAPGAHAPAYVEAHWFEDGGVDVQVGQDRRRLQLAKTSAGWDGAVGAHLERLLHADGFRELRHRITLTSPHSGGHLPTSAVVLLDRTEAAGHLPLPPHGPEGEAASEMVRYATALLENATRAAARQAADRVAAADADGAERPRSRDLTAAAARAVQEAADLDAVVVTTGDPGAMRVAHVAPDRSSLLGLPLLAGETLDDDARATLARTFGWEAVADAHRAPVVYRGRVLGAIWALSGDCGPHIGWHRREILQQVATSLAVELDKAFARSRLEDLNALSSRIAGKAGLQLARAMHPELQAWVRTYVHPEAEAAVVARTSAQVDLVSACPHTWTAEQVRALQSDSRRWGHRDVTIKPSDLTGLGEPFYGLAVPIALHEAATERVTRRRPTDAADRAAAGAEAMHGHLIVLSRAPLPMHHLLAMRDASRELAVVLDAERVRHALMAESGMFRHALLAPIQGLTDAALFLADLASEVDPDPELIVENRRRVNNEAERVRQWRVVQNLYGGGLISGEVRLHPRRQALYPMIETCMRRYDHTFQQRNISLLLERESARLHIVTTFDQEAMEIVVNNLLDNAAKYTFNNRTVTVGLEQDRAWARLWVRNFGHPLPEGMDIYGAGNRLPWEDRFRVIHGQGLGLYIVRTLVLAHGGRIEHSCRPMQSPNQGSWNGKAHDGAPARDETRPYIVQFTVSLPRDDAR